MLCPNRRAGWRASSGFTVLAFLLGCCRPIITVSLLRKKQYPASLYVSGTGGPPPSIVEPVGRHRAFSSSSHDALATTAFLVISLNGDSIQTIMCIDIHLYIVVCDTFAGRRMPHTFAIPLPISERNHRNSAVSYATISRCDEVPTSLPYGVVSYWTFSDEY